MATKNICEVGLLDSMTASENAIVDSNGTLKKMNLKKEFDKVEEEISELNSNLSIVDGSLNKNIPLLSGNGYAVSAASSLTNGDHFWTLNPSSAKYYNPLYKLDSSNIGIAVLSEFSNYYISKIKIGTNPNTSKRALVIEWYADGTNYTSYIDVTS